jgi:hypothetical protein
MRLDKPGAALIPPSPTMLSATALQNGDTQVQWIRRSRDGWRWIDHVDAPLVEERELYQIVVTPGSGPERTYESQTTSWTYLAADRAADLASGATVITIKVTQLGTFAPSRAAQISLALT